MSETVVLLSCAVADARINVPSDSLHMALPITVILEALRGFCNLEAITFGEGQREIIQHALAQHPESFVPATSMEDIEGGVLGSFKGVTVRCIGD